MKKPVKKPETDAERLVTVRAEAAALRQLLSEERALKVRVL